MKLKTVALIILSIMTFASVSGNAGPLNKVTEKTSFSGNSSVEQLLTIDKCIDIALERNRDIILAKKELEQAKLKKLSAVSGFLPLASGSVSANSLKSKGELYFMGHSMGMFEESDQNYGSSFSVSMPLFSGGAVLSSYRIAVENEQIAGLKLEEKKRSVILQIRLKYNSAVLAKVHLELQKDNLTTGELLLKKVEKRFELGMVPKSDVLRIKADVAGYREAVVRAQTNYRIALYDLLNLLDFPLETSIGVVDRFPSPDTTFNVKESVVPEDREDLRVADLGIKVARLGVDASRAGFLPNLSLSGRYAWMDSDLENIDQMFDMNYNWNVSLTLSLPLFAGFSVYNNYRLSVSELKSAEFSKEILIKSAEKELASARLEYCSDLERYKLSGIRIDLAKEEMRFAEKSYEEGLVTMLDVIQARNGLQAALASRAEILFSLSNAKAQIDFHTHKSYLSESPAGD